MLQLVQNIPDLILPMFPFPIAVFQCAKAHPDLEGVSDDGERISGFVPFTGIVKAPTTSITP